MRKPVVLFTFVKAGMGHIIPTQSLSKKFTEKYGDKCEILNSYIFEESCFPEVRKMGKELESHTVKTSSNWLYNKVEAISYAFSSKLTLKFLDGHFKKAIPLFLQDLANIKPDLIVSSYYLPNHLAVKSNDLGLTDTLIATYSPDPYIYPAWNRNCHLLMVNNDKAFDMATNSGFDNVKKIPCLFRDEIVNEINTKQSARKALELEDKFTLLYTGGAYGTNGTAKLIKKLLKANLNINLVVVCGKSESIYNQISALYKFAGKNTSFTVIGFTDKLPTLISASDVVIGKAGSNTLMEVAHLNRPLIVYKESSALEVNAAKYCESVNTCIRIPNANKIVNFIKKAIDCPTILNSFAKKDNPFSEKDGAEKASDLLFELLKTKFEF